MELIEMREINKGSLRAVATVRVPKWGNVLLLEVCYCESNGKNWVTLPAKPYEKDGKKKYWPYVAFEDNKLENIFKEQIRELFKKQLVTTEQAVSDDDFFA